MDGLIAGGIAVGGLGAAALLARVWNKRKQKSLPRRLAAFTANAGAFDAVTTEQLFADLARGLHKAMVAQERSEIQRLAGQLQQLSLHGLGKEAIASAYLTAQSLQSSHAGDVETAILLLGAGAEMFYRQPDQEHGRALENLRLLCHAAYKARQRIVLVQIAETLAVLLAQTTSPLLYTNSLKILGDTGLAAMRLKDEAMYREIIQLSQGGLLRAAAMGATEDLLFLLENWLHLMGTTADARYFAHYQELVQVLLKEGNGFEDQANALARQWCQEASITARYHRSPYGPWILELCLKVACRKSFIGSRRHAISMIFQVAEQQVVRQGLQGGFFMFRPILECARKILIQQQAFRYWEAEERREVMYLLVRGCVALAAAVARKEIMLTPGEVITEIYELWCRQSDAGEKYQRSMKRFCQLVHLYWQKTWWRQARKQQGGPAISGSGKWNHDTEEMLETIL